MRRDPGLIRRPHPGSTFVLMAGIFWLHAGSARADQPIRAPKATRVAKVAVLPFATTAESLEMYGKPVADAVARALAQELEPEPRLEVFALSLTGSVPARVDWVIDGRIVTSAEGISLEAGVRDPERGRRLAHVGTRTAKLTDIDQLSRALGAALAPHIESARAPRSGRRPRAPGAATEAGRITGASTTGQAAHHPPTGTPADTPEHTPDAPDSQPDDRPVMLIFRATGRAAGGVVDVDAPATRAAEELALSLGFRPVLSDTRGLLQLERARTEVREQNARLGLMIDVRRVDFAWYRVLAARARVRAVLLDDQGTTLYQGTLRTDTVVGNRGDRHSALVGFALRQAMDILRPHIMRAIRPRGDHAPR